jgi:hypothetical protein
VPLCEAAARKAVFNLERLAPVGTSGAERRTSKSEGRLASLHRCLACFFGVGSRLATAACGWRRRKQAERQNLTITMR